MTPNDHIAAETTDTTDAVDADGRDQNRDPRRRVWWIVVLLLLLLLTCGLIAQYLFPTVRGTSGKPSIDGLTAVYSVYGLHQPLGVSAGPDGEMLVSDTGVQKLMLFDKNGQFVRQVGGDLPADKVFSVDGSLNDDGSWYVCDWSKRQVWIFAPDGTVRSKFPQDPMAAAYGESGFTPYDIAKFGDDFLVTSRDGIYRFDGSTGELEGRFNTSDDRVGALNFPNGIAVDAESKRVYVCDTLGRRVVAYDDGGSVVWTLGQPDVAGEIKSFFGLPRGIEVTDKGLLVSDTFHHTLYLLDFDGNLLGTYGRRGVVDGSFNFPEALAVAPDGLIYVADRENNRAQALRLNDPEPVSPDVQNKWKSNYERFDE